MPDSQRSFLLCQDVPFMVGHCTWRVTWCGQLCQIFQVKSTIGVDQLMSDTAESLLHCRIQTGLVLGGLLLPEGALLSWALLRTFFHKTHDLAHIFPRVSL